MKKQYPVFRLVSSVLIISLAIAMLPVVRANAANLNHNYPRLAYVFHKPNLSQDRVSSLKKWDVLVLSAELGYDSSSGLNSIRAQNPNVVLLSYVNTMLITKRGAYGYDSHYNYLKLLAAEASGAPGWFLYNQYGNHVIRWPNTLSLNLSDVCPIYNGKRWSEYLADFVHNEIMRDYPWEGIFYDDAHQYASWMSNGNLDLNNDGIKDSSSYIDEHWSSGFKTLFSRSRANEGGSRIIIGNGGYTLYTYGNGRFLENFPKLWSGATWDSMMQEYLAWLSNGLSPQLSIISANNGDSGDQLSNLKKMRFTLTSALLGDGYFCYDDQGRLWWFDEYSVDANGNATGDDSAKGYLGKPKGAASRLSNGTWRRDFDRGIVLVNPTSQAQTVNLEKTHKKIKGTQAPSVNDGSLVTTVTLASEDGIILLDQNGFSLLSASGRSSGAGGAKAGAGGGSVINIAHNSNGGGNGLGVGSGSAGGASVDGRLDSNGRGAGRSGNGGGSAPGAGEESADGAGGTDPASVRPQTVGHVRGLVVNVNRQPISGTAIRAGGIVVPTNPGGEFRINDLPTGVYTVYYDAPGYASQVQELIPVFEDQTTDTPMVIMSPSSTSGGSPTGEIFGKVVSRARQTIPGTCIKIDASLMPTNPGGEFRFTLVHPGLYTVYYDAPLHRGQIQVIEVKAGSVATPPTVIMSR